jgi:hypothetical protein
VPPEPACTPPPTQPRPGTAAPREVVGAKVFDFETARRERQLTQAEAAAELGVPRTTLLGWRDRLAACGLTPVQRAFFESPEGVRFLGVLFVAALFVMNVCGGLGVAMVRTFFTLIGLAPLVACSETTLLRARRTMLAAIGTWGDTQDARLAQGMAPKDILACVDENFHERMMLVAIEAVSGFILLEQTADRRDGATWATALRTALAKWPVRLLGLVGDEAQGLIRAAKIWLGVGKGSDLFHVEHEVCRGTAGARAQQVSHAAKALDAARTAAAAAEAARAGTTGCSLDETVRLAAVSVVAGQAVAAAQTVLAAAEAHRAEVHAAVRDFGDRYHPIDLATGALCAPDAVATRLHAGFATIRTRVGEAGVASQRRVHDALAKAERVLPSLIAMVATWHRVATDRITALGLSAAETAWVWATLLPGVYLDRIAPQGRDKDVRARLRGVRDGLVAAIHAPDSPWTTWSAATRARVLAVVETCVDLFVRTSSCVEGRNGQLALYHHRTHHLSTALLKALTVIHNYVLTRADGTTAAQRFAGRTHDDLFQHLVAGMPVPARPRVRKAKDRPPLLATG